MAILSNFFYRVNEIPNKFLASYSKDISNLILKFMWRGKMPRIVNPF